MDFSYIYAALLGIIQGISEFLPISSSGHLILFSWLVNNKPLPIELNVALHLGTLFAILIFFRQDWKNIIRSCFDHAFKKQPSHTSTVLVPAILLGSIPAGIIGILWKDQIEAIFHNPTSVILPLAGVGFILWYADKKFLSNKNISSISILDGILIGCAQAVALIPGVSRSGSTIIAGRILKLERGEAARFSFLLGTPAMGGAALLHGKNLFAHIGDPLFIIGFFTSFIVGYLSIKFFLSFLKKFGFLFFAIYRLIIATIIAILVFT